MLADEEQSTARTADDRDHAPQQISGKPLALGLVFLTWFQVMSASGGGAGLFVLHNLVS